MILISRSIFFFQLTLNVGTEWKRAKRRYLNLRKLGTRSKIAGGYAKTSKGYWRIAKTIGHNTGMTNQWLLNEGLIVQL